MNEANYDLIQTREALFQTIVAQGDLHSSHVAIYLTILFAYIAVAWVAGRQLSRLQLTLTTLLFVTAAAWEVINVTSLVLAINIKRAELLKLTAPTIDVPSMSPLLNAAILSLGVLAALVFMWSVRREPHDDD